MPISLSDHPAFEVLDQQVTMHGPARLLRHLASQARLLLVLNPAPEPVFTISFPTAPRDDRGAAHVLEHLIFRRSQRFAADPLYPALTEGVMASFLNASTRPQFTTFHGAAPLGSELARLAEVLLDAVFHPRLAEAAFREEAWERAAPRAPAHGIILSEMREYMAQPQNALAIGLRRALLNGLPAGFNQGGAPAALTDLTLAQVRDFHARHFHPGNAFLTLWGDTAAKEVLPLLDVALKRAMTTGLPGAALTRVADPDVLQARPLTMHQICYNGHQPYCAIGWLLPEALPVPLLLVLESLLFQGADARLRGLPGFAPGPASALLQETDRACLTIALRPDTTGARSDAGEMVQKFLADCARRLTTDDILAAIRKARLRLEDNDTDPRRPAGLRVVDWLTGPWLRGADPFRLLDLPAELATLQDDPAVVMAAIRDLLDGPALASDQCSIVCLDPKEDPAPALVAPQSARADTGVGGKGFDLNFHSRAAALPQAIHLPSLKQDKGGNLLRMGWLGDNLARLQLAWQAHPLRAGQVLALPGYCRALRQYLATAAEFAGLVQGITAEPVVAQTGISLQIGFTSLVPDFPAACQMLARLLDQMPADQGDHDPRPAMRAMMAQRPQAVIGLRALARLSPAAALADQLAGPGLLLASHQQPPGDLLAELRRFAPIIAVSGTTSDAARIFDRGDRPDPLSAQGRPLQAAAPIQGDGFAVASQFHALALGMQCQRPAASRAALRAIEAEYLWPRIRGEGGAYGLRTTVDACGEAVLLTARDPHLLRTLDILRQSGSWLLQNADQSMLDRCRRGAAGQLLTPKGARAQMQDAIAAQFGGPAPGSRENAELRDLQDLDLAGFRAAGAEMQSALHAAAPVVFGPADSLRAALLARPGCFTLR